MGEAILSRLGEGESISNDVKESLGLPNNATLDDVIMALSLRDSEYATIVITVKDDYGKPLSNATVQMRDLAGGIYNYSSNEKGQCIFKTNAGSATFQEIHNFVDILNNQTKSVDCPVGSVNSITLQRVRRNNGENVIITSNKNIVFSNSLNMVDVLCVGAGGIAGMPYCDLSVYCRKAGWSMSTNIQRFTGPGGNGYSNTKTISIEGGKEYACIVGMTGPQTINTDSGWYKWGRNASYDYPGTTGYSGGTTSFGGVISATGGGGGKPNNASGAGAGSAIIGGYGQGSNSASVQVSSSGVSKVDETRQVTFRVGAYNTSTGNGCIKLSNFIYK